LGRTVPRLSWFEARRQHPAAQSRPGTHEWFVWEGQAADKAEALKCAEKADPRVDLRWMRIRHERDLDIR
jgi:hypothetical protein